MHPPSFRPPPLSRRELLRVSLGAGGVLCLEFGARPATAAPSRAKTGTWAPNAWVRVSPEDEVTVVLSQSEMGQGITTTLPAILADELGADWTRVRLEMAEFDPAYRNPRANLMFTGNSESIQSFHDLMRRMGASTRDVLMRAAARRWRTPVTDCTTEKGAVVHSPSGRTIRFGALVREAATLKPNPDAPLRPRNALHLRGTSLPRVDIPAKVDGSAVFGVDVTRPGMLVAAVRTAPTYGGTLKRFDERKVQGLPGVHSVQQLPGGVAVLADTWWRAHRALRVLAPEFEAGPNAAMDTASLRAKAQSALDSGPVVTPFTQGDSGAAFAATGADRVVVRDFENPCLAHATLEPMNATADVRRDRCDVWAPTQGVELAQIRLRELTGLPDGAIHIHRTFLGGGFGRRLIPDFIEQAVLLSKAVHRPVKVIWDREEDIRRDWFRPMSLLRLRAALGADGLPRALDVRLVSPTILLPVFPPIAPLIAKGLDPSCLEGLTEAFRYDIPHRRVEFHLLQVAMNTSVLRTTGYGPNLTAVETFVDELAALAGMDGYRYRRALLRNQPEALRVVDRAAALARWDLPPEPGRARGIAFAHAFGTRLAQVAEVSVRGAEVRLHRLVTVADPGEVLDPRIAEAGLEGGVIFGLTGCKSEITFATGQAVEDNLDRYPLLLLGETPELVTELAPGGGALGGVGEVSPVTVAPALLNALAAATGKRLRSLPLSRHGLRFV